MKQKYFLVLIFLFPLFSFSQTITFCDTLGASIFIGGTDSVFFIKCKNSMSDWDKIYSYDTKTLKRIASYYCDIQDRENGRVHFKTPIIIDGKLTYFATQEKMFGRKSILKFIQPFNDKTYPIDTMHKEKHEWIAPGLSFRGSGYILSDIIKINEDSILLYIRTAPIEMYTQPTPDANVKAKCILFDKHFNKIVSNVEFKNYEIDDLKSDRINFAKKNLYPYIPSLVKCTIQKINYEFDKVKKQCRVYGLFTSDSIKELHLADGYFEYTINNKNDSIISKKIQIFPDGIIKLLTPETDKTILGKAKDNIEVYTSFKFSNGTYITVYHRKEIEILFDGKTKTNFTHTIFKDIYVLAVDKEGKYLWTKKIDRYINQDNDCDTKDCLPYMTVLNGSTSANIFYYTRDKGLAIKEKQVFNYSFNYEGINSEEEMHSELKNIYKLRSMFHISENIWLCMLDIGRQKYCLTKIILK